MALVDMISTRENGIQENKKIIRRQLGILISSLQRAGDYLAKECHLDLAVARSCLESRRHKYFVGEKRRTVLKK